MWIKHSNYYLFLCLLSCSPHTLASARLALIISSLGKLAQLRISQSQHYWLVGPADSLLLRASLWILECLAASVTSTY